MSNFRPLPFILMVRCVDGIVPFRHQRDDQWEAGRVPAVGGHGRKEFDGKTSYANCSRMSESENIEVPDRDIWLTCPTVPGKWGWVEVRRDTLRERERASLLAFYTDHYCMELTIQATDSPISKVGG
ncbi:hypothetical protein Btru_069538, partial [Bulinus truncatus]